MFGRRLLSILAGGMLATVAPSFAQISQQWNTQAYELAQSSNARAISYLNAGKTDKAMELLNRAVTQDPNNPTPFITMGNLLCSMGHYDEALDCMRKSYKLHHSSEALLGAGMVYYREHDYDGAIQCWNKIIQTNPHRAQVYADIGMAYLRKGQLDEATQSFDHVVKYDPNSSLGYYGLALSNYFAGSLTASKETAERAQSIDGTSPGVLLLARIEFLQGNRAMGTKLAQQFISMIRKKTPSRSMTELGFNSQSDFHFDPFLIDNYDNGYLTLAREEKSAQRKSSLNRKGQLNTVLAQAERAYAESLTVECDQSGGVHNTGGVWSTGVSHDLTHDVFISHEIGLLQLSEGDYSGAAHTFNSVLAQNDAYNVDLLYLAQALAMEGKHGEASEKLAQFRKRQPGEQLAASFEAIASVPSTVQ